MRITHTIFIYKEEKRGIPLYEAMGVRRGMMREWVSRESCLGRNYEGAVSGGGDSKIGVNPYLVACRYSDASVRNRIAQN